jgi:hypothetical protein
MKPCASCGRNGELQPQRSVLDNRHYDCCVSCIEHRAEPLAAVVRAVNQAGWRSFPRDTRRAIRVFDLEEYIRIPDWARRMSHRQLAMIRQEQEDRELLATVKQHLAKPATAPEPEDMAGSSSPRSNLFSWIRL